MTHENRESGQVALMVILVVLVISVVVLSVVGRSVTEVRVTSTEEDAAKALRLAEAGVEEALRSLSATEFSSEIGDGSYSVTATQEGALGVVSAAPVADGDVLEITLVGVGIMPTSVDLYWGDKSDAEQTAASTMAAVEVAVYNNTAGTMSVRHLAFDPEANRRTNTTKMTAPTANPGVYEGVNYLAKANVPLQAGDTQVRIKTAYGRALMAVKPLPDGTIIPTQQFRVVSQGEVGGETTRAVEVTRSNPMLPGIFDAVLYSGGAISK